MSKNNPEQTRISFLQKIGLILSGLLLTLIILEIGLRLEGLIMLSWQEHRNLQAIKQKGAYRIMCLGESTTQGQYPPYLEKILNRRNTGVKFSVIDKGMPSVDTFYILAHLEENLDKYQPDMVTTMMGANDTYVKYYEDITDARTFLFNKLHTYRFLRILWTNMAKKIRKTDIEEKAEAIPPACNISGVGKLVQAEEKLTRAIQLNPRNDAAYIQLGVIYRNEGKQTQSEESFKKALEVNPGNDSAYLELGYCYRNERRFLEAEEAFKKAIQLNPRNDAAYIQLGRFYRDHYRKGAEAEQAFKKAIELNPQNDEAYADLGWYYAYYGKFAQAEQAFRKVIELDPMCDKGYRGLAALYSQMGKDGLSGKYYAIASKLMSGYCSLTTAHNYQELKTILDKRGIRLVCIQYPMCGIEPLKRIFDNSDNIIFVSNERIFKDAVRKEGYEEYFVDMFAGDFGHCTRKGNRLLAENIANVILKEAFGK